MTMKMTWHGRYLAVAIAGLGAVCLPAALTPSDAVAAAGQAVEIQLPSGAAATARSFRPCLRPSRFPAPVRAGPAPARNACWPTRQLAVRYEATVHIAAINEWLRHDL
jgi:hypothetical protein